MFPWLNLLSKWSVVFSKNKYNVRLTNVEYKIQLQNEVPVKGYVPRHTLAVVSAINDKLDKLEQVDFIEPSISPYSAPNVYFSKSKCLF